MITNQTLKNAARAIEHDLWTDPSTQANYLVKDGAILRRWEPLEDDGDSLRLAVQLELGVVCKRNSDPYERNTSVVTNPYCVHQIRIAEPHMGNPEAATRRAIVLAAARIGSAL